MLLLFAGLAWALGTVVLVDMAMIVVFKWIEMVSNTSRKGLYFSIYCIWRSILYI